VALSQEPPGRRQRAVLLLFYAVVLVPDFFANQDPEATGRRASPLFPLQWISLFGQTGFTPSVPEVVGKTQSGHAENGMGAR